MKHRQTDTARNSIAALKELRALPRPVFGEMNGLPNRAIRQRHSHAWGQLSYALQGVVEVATETGSYVAPPQCAIWIPQGVPHGVECSDSTVIRSLYIRQDAVHLDRTECRVLAVTPLLRELIRAFSTFPAEYDEDGREGRLVQVLLDELADAPELGLMLPWPGDRRLQKICRQLQEHPDLRMDLFQFAEAMGVSEKTLSRLFLKDTGLTFRLWRQRARLLSSMMMLERGDRITDVALACGYHSMSAFIAAFRAQFGATPREVFQQRTASM